MEARSLRILVVEHHADIRMVLAMTLDLLGHQGTYARDAPSALRAAAGADFDVLLTDVGLPGRDGWELMVDLAAAGCLAASRGKRPTAARRMSRAAGTLSPWRLHQELAPPVHPVSP